MRVVTKRVGIGEVLALIFLAVLTIGIVIGFNTISHDNKSTLDEIKKVNSTVADVASGIGGLTTNTDGKVTGGSGMAWLQHQTLQQIGGVKTDVATAKASADAAKTEVESLRAKMAEGFQSLKDEIGKVPKAVAKQPATIDELIEGIREFSGDNGRRFAKRIIEIGKNGEEEGETVISRMVELLPNKKAIYILEQIGDNVLDASIGAFNKADIKVREAAKAVVVKIGGPKAIEKLTAVMNIGSATAKALAFQAYAEITGFVPTPAPSIPAKPAAPKPARP